MELWLGPLGFQTCDKHWRDMIVYIIWWINKHTRCLYFVFRTNDHILNSLQKIWRKLSSNYPTTRNHMFLCSFMVLAMFFICLRDCLPFILWVKEKTNRNKFALFSTQTIILLLSNFGINLYIGKYCLVSVLMFNPCRMHIIRGNLSSLLSLAHIYN